MKTYVLHTDPGHGWLAVKRKELEELGILDQISCCSYQKGGTVYLEEDGDLDTFAKAKEANGEKLTHDNIRYSYRENSPIRNYEDFTPFGKHGDKKGN